MRARGITVFQFFGKVAQVSQFVLITQFESYPAKYPNNVAQFFGTNVNPIGLDTVNGIGWKFLIVYSVWIAIEAILIYFLWPETSGRTLEELAFCEYPLIFSCLFS